MPSNANEVLPKEEKSVAVGEVILGKRDPRLLSYEEFIHDPDVLYHGSAEPLKVNPNFDYDELIDSAGETLGRGLYTTDKPAAAYGYARLRNLETRGLDSLDVPTVTPVLPYEARMFDFRDKTGQSNFVEVPEEILTPYVRKFAEHAKRWLETDHSIQKWKQIRVNNALLIMKNWLETKKPVTLFELVSATPNNTNVLGGLFPEALHETFAELGYDGIIHPDGGQAGATDSKGAVSYVFYNLNKVGSYQDWQKRKNLS